MSEHLEIRRGRLKIPGSYQEAAFCIDSIEAGTPVSYSWSSNMQMQYTALVTAIRPMKKATDSCGRMSWRTPGARLMSGGSTIMRRAPTLHCSGQHPLNSPARKEKMPPAGRHVNRVHRRAYVRKRTETLRIKT
ncbi:hypothetical protein SAMN05216315_12019 [Nitrosospira sp. Nsp18]|nr:hypothetical protein SAMN05216315_12019 [Nitrosospira sp. Nsp18]